MYDDHHRLVGKHVVDFLLVLIELFLLDVTAEALRANIGAKSAILLQRGSVDRKFCVESAGCPKISGTRGRPPLTILLLRKLG